MERKLERHMQEHVRGALGSGGSEQRHAERPDPGETNLHVSVDVKYERFLAKVGAHVLSWPFETDDREEL